MSGFRFDAACWPRLLPRNGRDSGVCGGVLATLARSGKEWYREQASKRKHFPPNDLQF